MQFTHLVTNGCSWTYGTGLSKIKETAWPARLAYMLRSDVVNLAVPGTGNESITRRTYEYVYENKKFNNQPLFVLVFSQLWRKEVWMHDYYGSETNDYCTMYPAQQRNGNPQEVAWLHEFNEEDFLRKNMLVKFAAKNLFDSLGYPFIICDFCDNDVKLDYINQVKNRFPNWYSEYVSINDISNLDSFVTALDKTDCNHPGPSSQEVLADIIYQAIIKKYNSYEVVRNCDFLKLKDYLFHNPNNLAVQRYTDWF